jgi:membrane-bound ClpP family serine protease
VRFPLAYFCPDAAALPGTGRSEFHISRHTFHDPPDAHRKEGMVGEIGTTRTDLAPEGKVFVHGELWQAEADGFIPSDATVKVTRVTGLILKVTKADERIII